MVKKDIIEKLEKMRNSVKEDAPEDEDTGESYILNTVSKQSHKGRLRGRSIYEPVGLGI
jgi:hypothetical protein